MYEYGTWKNLSVFKDKKGFYVEQYNTKTNEIYRKYLKNWKQTSKVMKTVKGKWKKTNKYRKNI